MADTNFASQGLNSSHQVKRKGVNSTNCNRFYEGRNDKKEWQESVEEWKSRKTCKKALARKGSVSGQDLVSVEILKKIWVANVKVDEYDCIQSYWMNHFEYDPQSAIRSLQMILKGQDLTNSCDIIELMLFLIIAWSFWQLQKLAIDNLIFNDGNTEEKQLPQSLVL